MAANDESRLRTIDMKDERNRYQTFTNWPIRFISKSSLAKSGFYWLNKDDAVKCAYCSGVIAQWENGDDPFVEHKKFFPACPKVLADSETLEDSETGIHTAKPKSLNFATIDSRVRSFSNWTKSNVQTPEELAKAGFFYLGIDDEVRCFYCDGGLRFWLKEDNPFFEHARYFPKCAYVQLVKGKTYVDQVLEQAKKLKSGDNNPEVNGQTSGRVATTMSLEDAMSSNAVTSALSLGLDMGRIRIMTQRKLNMTGQPYSNVEELIEDVLDEQIHDEGETWSDRTIENQVSRLLLSAVSSVGLMDDTNQPGTSTSQNVPNKVVPVSMEQSSSERNRTPEEENPQQKSGRELDCKICMVEEVGVVFLPCGHLLSCPSCSTGIEKCPICRTEIKGRIRTFLS